jgi:peptidoglycan/LPS O-acetylase OafA/YrhL
LFRLLGLLGLICWAHQSDRWEMVLFFAGFVLAEMDVARREEQDATTASTSSSPSANTSFMSHRSRKTWNTIFIATFVIGLYFGGQPARGLEHAPGWTTLASLIPHHVKNWRQRYWPNWGAMLLIWATSNHAPLQRIFTNRFAQYLGQISYPLYLCHGAIIHTLGYATLDVLWKAWGHDTFAGKEGGFAIAAVLSVSTTIWAADVFMRAVDTPTVKFAKWLEGKLTRK